jgi:hypothetical protein
MKQIVKTLLGLVLLLGMVIQVRGYDIRSGLLSYYPFTTTITNDVAFTNNFSTTNAPTLVTTNPAPRGSALQLSGTSQHLFSSHPTDNAVNGMPIYRAGTYSITMWVKSLGTSTVKYLFSHGNSTTGTPFLAFQTGNVAANSNKLDVIIRNDGNSTLLNHAVSSNVVFNNVWHHIAWVDSNGSVKLYIDGALDGNSALFSYSRSGTFTFDRTGIGALVRTSAAGFFNGAIDDLSLWERALSQAEVQDIMANGITTPVPALPPALVAEPVSVTKNNQDAVTFSVTAVGTRPNNVLTYQWNSNGFPILDATNRTYRKFNLVPSNSGELYSVTVSNAVDGVTSSNATLTVLADGPANVVSNIVSYWPLDSVTNNAGIYTTPDLYSGNTFLLTNNMTDANLVSTGYFGNALSFDNFTTNAVLRTGGAPLYNNAGYSVSIWVNKTDGATIFQSDARLFAEGSTNSANPIFSIGTPTTLTNLVKIYIRYDAGVELVNRASTRSVFDGAWHHLVWTDTNGLGKLYVDGVLDETDFTYTPSGTFTLTTTSVGALARATFGNGIFAYADEVATWTRPLSYTDIQQVRTASIPAPVTINPPVITSQPVGTNVFTKADVSFAVGVSGTAPFFYQWKKGGIDMLNETNAVLSITNVQLANAGDYSVSISNSAPVGPANPTNSQTATLGVTTRPAAPSTLAIDFSNRGQTNGFTQSGFDSFTLDGIGATSAKTTRLFGGVEVTAGGNGVTTADSRLRTVPVNTFDFTEQLLLQDFIYSVPATGTDGLDITVKFMEPNQQYGVTVWSYDGSQGAGDRISDWYVDGNLVKDNYAFNTSNTLTNNAQYQFSFYATSDANGKITIQGRREISTLTSVATVFLNALKISLPTGPTIDKQPVGASAFTGADVRFYAVAVGAGGPFTYQWYKDNVPVGAATSDSFLQLSNIALSAAGTYTVTVADQSAQTTTSSNAVLTVTQRPAPPSVLAIDFNERNQEIGFTDPDFNSFALGGTGSISVPTTKVFGGVEVTVVGSNGTTVNSRHRPSITNMVDFTQESLLQDFIYSAPTTGLEGLDVNIRFMAPNQLYNFTIWSFDDQNPGQRVSDWSVNGVLLKDDYTFEGSTASEPTNNLQYQFSFNATSDANGTLLLQGRRELSSAGIGVFLGALKVAIPATIISNVELIGGNIRLTVSTPDSSKAHSVEQTADLSTSFTGPVSGVTTTILSPTSLQLEFAQPIGGIHFYRINRAP